MYPRIHTMTDGQRIALCEQFTVRSAFQPIVSVAHQRIVGYEGLARIFDADGAPRSPADLFQSITDIEFLVRADRACRELHLKNFMHAHLESRWLFLNVHPLVAMHGHQFGSFFAQLLETLNVEGWRIVIEVVESELPDETQLMESIEFYRSLGCLIALDDFGVGGSQFTRLWRINADIVKLDRSLIVESEHSYRAQRTLPSLVAMIHEAGSMVLQEGIETPKQLAIALNSGADLLQGFGLAKPALLDQKETFDRDFLDQGLKDSSLEMDRADYNLHQQIVSVTERFEDMLVALERGESLRNASRALLSMAIVARVFVLDARGYQVEETIHGAFAPASIKNRFRPLAQAEGACWAKRPYFRRAMIEPSMVQISRPYLSVAGGNLCRTLSYCRGHAPDNGIKVVCCDINWLDD
ncbi:diguanylate phosphodiesterase [Halothiobacillus neapolitanus c2]|uniref:Diguanylate phosphodiesterase n=1 Tax=Halothiobacillus neapolitanus (strain ATCC 23641 / DSM 15147 / CIP 104769 / NCIMB 8539 / c2) TaxID=555778 RepID=D0KZY9_HALNC|nr:diguanylate phosphodiesterase [Halothiobacillus neapolitanus c2]TDN66320.1 EAL domain-containing protein (putative c-di-GMP-specific phosphodiesterase class I) [Halothiobacillus neapolitanus]